MCNPIDYITNYNFHYVFIISDGLIFASHSRYHSLPLLQIRYCIQYFILVITKQAIIYIAILYFCRKTNSISDMTVILWFSNVILAEDQACVLLIVWSPKQMVNYALSVQSENKQRIKCDFYITFQSKTSAIYLQTHLANFTSIKNPT